jgi:hypothetical protein
MSTTAGSSSSTPPSDTSNTNPSTSEPKKETPLLPASSTDPNSTELDMSTGQTTIKLDHLGPMVINVDGTMSRISNWEKMADIEKENTLRIIAKRNQSRLEALRKKDSGA